MLWRARSVEAGAVGPGQPPLSRVRALKDGESPVPDHSLAGDGFPLLPEELRMLRETVRRFMRDEVRPLDEAQPHDAFALPAADLAALNQKAKALGLWCLASPDPKAAAD